MMSQSDDCLANVTANGQAILFNNTIIKNYIKQITTNKLLSPLIGNFVVIIVKYFFLKYNLAHNRKRREL